MQHPPHHIDGVFRTVKVFCKLLCHTSRKLYLHIIPSIHIDFLYAFPVNVLCKKTKLCHLRINSIDQLIGGLSCHLDPVILDVLPGKPADLSLSFLISIRSYQTAVLFGKIGLYLPQHRSKIPACILRCKEQIMGA